MRRTTIILPEANNKGAKINVSPGAHQVIRYTLPPGAESAELMFWMHAFPPGPKPNSMYLLWYLNEPKNPKFNARRMGHDQNAVGHNGRPVSFSMGGVTVSKDEQFIVSVVNNTNTEQEMYLAVTIQECWS